MDIKLVESLQKVELKESKEFTVDFNRNKSYAKELSQFLLKNGFKEIPPEASLRRFTRIGGSRIENVHNNIRKITKEEDNYFMTAKQGSPFTHNWDMEQNEMQPNEQIYIKQINQHLEAIRHIAEKWNKVGIHDTSVFNGMVDFANELLNEV